MHLWTNCHFLPLIITNIYVMNLFIYVTYGFELFVIGIDFRVRNCNFLKIVEEARLRAEKEEIERREQEKREAAERLLRDNEVRWCKIL